MADEFVDDAGPGFNADQAQAGADQFRHDQEAEARAAGVESFGIPDVPEEKVRHGLFVAGDGFHAAFGVGEYDWLMTQRDLDRIAPPLARIINRYEAAKVVAGFSDEAAVVMGVGLWGWRSVLERVAVLRAQERGELGSQPAPAPESARPVNVSPPAWPEAAPAPPVSPAPSASSASGVGGDFPGAGAPREPAVARVEVVDGYVTRAERIRQARETRPHAIPHQAPSQAE